MNNNNIKKAPNGFIYVVIGAAFLVGLWSLASSDNASTTHKTNVVLTNDNGFMPQPSSATTPTTRKLVTEGMFGWEDVPPGGSPTQPEFVSIFDLDFDDTSSRKRDHYNCPCIGGECPVCYGRKDTSFYSYRYSGPDPCTYCNATGLCPDCKGTGVISFD